MSTTTYVDRIEASNILKVSTRTVDRYMRKYRLKTRKDGRRVLIKRIDIDKIIKDQIGHLVDLDATMPTKESRDRVSMLTIKDVNVERREKSRSTIENEIYKDLYSEIKGDLKERQERLEAATYRVGQLESQVKNMVPLLDYDKKEREVMEVQTNMEQEVKKTKKSLTKMEATVRSERVAKWIYLSLVGLLLVAEPVLFLLWAFN